VKTLASYLHNGADQFVDSLSKSQFDISNSQALNDITSLTDSSKVQGN